MDKRDKTVKALENVADIAEFIAVKAKGLKLDVLFDCGDEMQKTNKESILFWFEELKTYMDELKEIEL